MLVSLGKVNKAKQHCACTEESGICSYLECFECFWSSHSSQNITEAVTGIKGMENLLWEVCLLKITITSAHFITKYQNWMLISYDFTAIEINTTHSAQLQHKCKLCIKPLVLPFFSMSLINNLKFVYSFCARGLKHFQLMYKTRSKKAGSKKRQDKDTPLRAIIHPNYRHRICTTDIAAHWGGRGARQRARNVSNKLGHLF